MNVISSSSLNKRAYISSLDAGLIQRADAYAHRTIGQRWSRSLSERRPLQQSWQKQLQRTWWKTHGDEQSGQFRTWYLPTSDFFFFSPLQMPTLSAKPLNGMFRETHPRWCNPSKISPVPTAIQFRPASGGGASQQGFRPEEGVAEWLQQPRESLSWQPEDGKPGQLDGLLQVQHV